MTDDIVINLFREKYGLSSRSSEALRSEIKTKLSEFHPDKNGGTFVDKGTEELFHRLNKAKEELDALSHDSTQLVPVSALRELAVLLSPQPTASSQGMLEQRLERVLIERSIQRRRVALFPRISLTALTAIVTFAWLFPNTIKEHPILSQYIDITSPLFSMAWFSTFIVTIVLWGFFFIREQNSKRLTSALKLEHYQNELFEQFILCSHRHHTQANIDPALRFEKKDFIDFVTQGKARETMDLDRACNIYDQQGVQYARSATLFHKTLLRARVDDDVVDSLADIIFARAEAHGVIRACDEKSLSKKYELVSGTELANKAMQPAG